MSTDHEYVLAYARTSEGCLRGVERDESKFGNPDDDPRGPWMSRSILGLATREQRPNLHYDLIDPTTGTVYPPNPSTGWRYSSDRMAEMVSEGRILFPSREGGRPREKKFRAEMQTDLIAFRSVIEDVYTADGTQESRELLGSGVFAFPKPTRLIKELVRQGTESDSTSIRRPGRAGLMANAPATRKNGVCEDAVLTLDRSTRSASLPQL